MRKKTITKPCKRRNCPYYNTYFEKCVKCEWNPDAVWTSKEKGKR